MIRYDKVYRWFRYIQMIVRWLAMATCFWKWDVGRSQPFRFCNAWCDTRNHPIFFRWRVVGWWDMIFCTRIAAIQKTCLQNAEKKSSSQKSRSCFNKKSPGHMEVPIGPICGSFSCPGPRPLRFWCFGSIDFSVGPDLCCPGSRYGSYG